MDRLPGFRDFFPEPLPSTEPWSCDVRQHIFDGWREVSRRYGFREYDGPPLEPLELYTTKSGAEIVGQLFNFVDKGERAVSLRPEITPTVARMVASAERSYKKPIKWFSIPQLFRYEKPQKGRLREHFQLNCDLFGEADQSADAEIIALLIDQLRHLGLDATDFVVRLSSRQAWQEFYTARGGSAEGAYEFFQIIDKMEREEPTVTRQKLSALRVDFDDVQRFIRDAVPTADLLPVVENLGARGLRDFVRIDYGVIRGLAYYTGVVFEAFDRKGDLRAIAGGGRYDGLVKLVSGGKVDLPALGFGMGDVVLVELLKSRGKLPKLASRIEVYVLIEDESLRGESLQLTQRLRESGIATEFPLTLTKGDKQFKRALELGAVATVKLEPTEAGQTIKAKHLATRQETLVLPANLENDIKKLLASH